MLLAIFIFLVLILILSVNIHVCLRSKDDNIIVYLVIGKFGLKIPHFTLDLSKKINVKRQANLTSNIISHSVLDRIYIAKYSAKNNILSCALFLIISNQIRGILHTGFRIVNYDEIKIIYDETYENVDYYCEAHISIITLIWALLKGRFYGTNKRAIRG